VAGQLASAGAPATATAGPPPAAVTWDPGNAEYRFTLDGVRGTFRVLCRSGRFTAGDIPGVHDAAGRFVDVRNLKLEADRVAGKVVVPSADSAAYALGLVVRGGQVAGTWTDGMGGRGAVAGTLSFPIASQEDIGWFETARLGIGQHWSISSVRYCSNSPSWAMQSRQCTKEQYEAQMKDFRAQNFDPAAWARLFREAGAFYYIPYVKHHDGFCMWDTHTHDYKVTRTPCGRDVIGELYAACRREGLRIGVRFSQADWHIMPLDMWPAGAGLHQRLAGADLDELARHFGKDGAAAIKVKGREVTAGQYERFGVYQKVWKEYRPIMMRQYEELLTKYGRIDLIGGDGGYPVSAAEQVEMAKKFRAWSPGIVFGSRVFFNCPVKFDTPVYEWPGERPRPDTEVLPPGARVPEVWQSYTHWGNGPRRGDTSRPLPELVTEKDLEAEGPTGVGLLVRCASVGWNLLYDVGPHDTGDLAAVNIAHLRALAKYMKANAESITGTWGGPYQPCWLTTADKARGLSGFAWGTSRKGERIYLHVTDWNGSQTVHLPPLPQRKVIAATLLATGEPVLSRQTDQALSVTVPAGKRQWVDTVIVLRLDGSTEDLPIVPVPAVRPAGK